MLMSVRKPPTFSVCIQVNKPSSGVLNSFQSLGSILPLLMDRENINEVITMRFFVYCSATSTSRLPAGAARLIAKRYQQLPLKLFTHQ
jgi:hypothetical protein